MGWMLGDRNKWLGLGYLKNYHEIVDRLDVTIEKNAKWKCFVIINDLSKELQQISVNLEYNESNGKANNKIYTDIDEECPTVHQ